MDTVHKAFVPFFLVYSGGLGYDRFIKNSGKLRVGFIARNPPGFYT